MQPNRFAAIPLVLVACSTATEGPTSARGLVEDAGSLGSVPDASAPAQGDAGGPGDVQTAPLAEAGCGGAPDGTPSSDAGAAAPFYDAGDAAPPRTGPYAVLVYAFTTGYRHASIPAGIDVIRSLGAAHGFRVDVKGVLADTQGSFAGN